MHVDSNYAEAIIRCNALHVTTRILCVFVHRYKAEVYAGVVSSLCPNLF